MIRNYRQIGGARVPLIVGLASGKSQVPPFVPSGVFNLKISYALGSYSNIWNGTYLLGRINGTETELTNKDERFRTTTWIPLPVRSWLSLNFNNGTMQYQLKNGNNVITTNGTIRNDNGGDPAFSTFKIPDGIRWIRFEYFSYGNGNLYVEELVN